MHKLHHRARDLTGQRFGYLTLVEPSGSRKGKTFWWADCDCGTRREVQASELTRKRGAGLFSCGCRTKEQQSEQRKTHGLSDHPLHAVWNGMRARCQNPNHPAYHNYGGRGIKVCERWKTFANFYADVSPTYETGLTLDRWDNNGDYTPENFRWTTWEVQGNNKRLNVIIPTPKGQMTVARASRAFGVNVTTILYRINAGWPDSLLLIPPDYTNRIAA